MKKLLLALIAVFMASNAFAVTAVIRKGEWITQYKLTDTAGQCENCLIYYSHRTPEVVIQTSSIDTTSWKESYGCWEDSDLTECPDDDIDGVTPGVQYRSPTLMLLEEAHLAGNTSIGATLTGTAERLIYLSFWHEYKVQKLITDMIAYWNSEGFLNPKKITNLTSVYVTLGVDEITAGTLATDRISNSLVANYDDYGLATVPVPDRRLLSILGAPASEWFGE